MFAHQEERSHQSFALALAVAATAAVASAAAVPVAAGPLLAGAAVLGVGALAVARVSIPWHWIISALLLVIMFIPIRRYTIALDLPIALEPYRVLVIALLAAWTCALLVDRRVRLRRTGLEVPLLVVSVAVLGSVIVNPDRLDLYQPDVVKAVSFLASFILVAYVVLSVVRTRDQVHLLLKTLVLSGAALALLAIVETRTGATPFNSLGAVLPGMQLDPSFDPALSRGVRNRAFGPAEHPIALGAALVMLIPLAAYLARHQKWWYVTLCALVLGALSTLSRTGVVMLAVVAATFLMLRWRETRRLWPLVVPVLVLTHFTMPGTLGTLKQSFFPEEGLVRQQTTSAGSLSSSGRVADLAPSLEEFAERPLLGYGYGTRIVTTERANARILDDQWLASLLDTGLVGVVGWLLVFLRFIRRAGGRGRRDDSDAGWLLVALTASVASLAVGMFTFDAFSFVQVMFLLFILIGLGGSVLGLQDADDGTVRRPGVIAAERA